MFDACTPRPEPARATNRVRRRLLVSSPAVLPVDVFEGDLGGLSRPEPGVEEGPDPELLFGALAGLGKPGGAVGSEGLPFVRVGPVAIADARRQR